MEKRNHVPVIAMRGISILPGMLIHFDVSRAITIEAVERAMLEDKMAFLVMQKKEEVENPVMDDLCEIGTMCTIKQMMKIPGDGVRVVVSGIERGRLLELTKITPMLLGDIMVVEEETEITPLRKQSMFLSFQKLLQQYGKENEAFAPAVKLLMEVTELSTLLDETAIRLPFDNKIKQGILEELELEHRFQHMVQLLQQEIEVNRIRQEFNIKVKEEIDQNQKEYFLREQMKVIRDELGDSAGFSDDAERFEEQLSQLQASSEVKEKIQKEINRYKIVAGNSAESTVSRSYVETLLELPWDKASKDTNDLKRAAKILDRDHYGLEQVKERILEFLAVRSLTKKGESPIICLVGPPGTGKTSIAHSVAEALQKQYIRIALGGVKDEAEIRGHRRTYIGAMPGRIVTGLKNAGVKNPLILLDEVDKVGSDYKGDPAAALLEVLDSDQNSRFVDHYVEIPVDLSEVLFLCTANDTRTIPRPLLDRMEMIEVTSYTENEKYHIAKEYLLEKQRKKNGLKKKQLEINAKALRKMISGYTREAGVRNLERLIGAVCRKAAREILEDNKEVVKVSEENLEQYLGKVKYSPDRRNSQNDVGIVRGLAWTAVGGVTLQVEVNVMEGHGKLKLTGQLGDVMKESASAALSYVRSISHASKLGADFYENHDIHVHIPEGAVPKDGPSAGITMATAIYSALTGKKVLADLAMTGEITLRGHVLPIGGLKEKLLAAKTAGIHTVLVPKQNEKDVEEISDEIKKGLHIQYVEQMQQVLKAALCPGEKEK